VPAPQYRHEDGIGPPVDHADERMALADGHSLLLVLAVVLLLELSDFENAREIEKENESA
jgi:hypothetical protein